MQLDSSDIRFLIMVAIVPLIGWFNRHISSSIRSVENDIKNLRNDLTNHYTKQENDRIIANEIKNIDDKLGHIKELFSYYVGKNENR